MDKTLLFCRYLGRFLLVRDEELAVDDGWHTAEVEPEVIEMHRNGACHGEAVGVAHGHHEEAVETQQFLFPWAEIMARRQRNNPRGAGSPMSHRFLY